MIAFKPITLSDKELIERYTLNCSTRNNDLSFANMFAWAEVLESRWAIVEDFLVIQYKIDGGCHTGYMQPIGIQGNDSFGVILPRLIEDAQKRGEQLRIIGLSNQGRKALCEGVGCDQFALHSARDAEDYIYQRSDLEHLQGKRYQAKRNHLNKFKSSYNFEIELLTSSNCHECLELYDKWFFSHGATKLQQDERRAMSRAFENWDALSLHGLAIKVEGEIIAFTMGSRINNELFCTHIEKADINFDGAYAAINQALAASLPTHYTLINREDDMGLEGLRKSKLSYHPIALQNKYTALHLNDKQLQCRTLWGELFDDSREEIDNFLVNHYSEDGAIYKTIDNQIVAMAHLIEFNCENTKCAYIFAVGTKGEHRSQGYASELIYKAIQKAKDEDFDLIATIPADENLRSWYTEFGFCGEIPTTFTSSPSYDFGTGDKELDKAMIINLSENQTPDTLVLTK